MPYKLRKAPKRDLYWVVGPDGKHHSKDPLPKARAEAQMRALYAAERREDEARVPTAREEKAIDRKTEGGGKDDRAKATLNPLAAALAAKETEKDQATIDKLNEWGKELAKLEGTDVSKIPPKLLNELRDILLRSDKFNRPDAQHIIDLYLSGNARTAQDTIARRFDASHARQIVEKVERSGEEKKASGRGMMSGGAVLQRSRSRRHLPRQNRPRGAPSPPRTWADVLDELKDEAEDLADEGILDRDVANFALNIGSTLQPQEITEDHCGRFCDAIMPSIDTAHKERIHKIYVGAGSLSGGGPLPQLSILQQIAKAAYSTSPPNEIGPFRLRSSTPTLKFYVLPDPEDSRYTDTIVVGIRGTNTSDKQDLWADTQLALGKLEATPRWTKDLADFKSFLSRIRDPDSVDIYGVGHSLGGAILDMFLKKGLIQQGVSYNPAISMGDAQKDIPNRRIYQDGDPLLAIMGRSAKNVEIRPKKQKEQSVGRKIANAFSYFIPYVGLVTKGMDTLDAHALDNFTGGTHLKNVLKKLGLKNEGHSLAELAKASRIPRKTLQEVYNRGIGAYTTNPTSVRMKGSFKKGVNAPMSQKLSKEQWAMARVYSFIDGNPKHDTDLRGGNLPPLPSSPDDEVQFLGDEDDDDLSSFDESDAESREGSPAASPHFFAHIPVSPDVDEVESDSDIEDAPPVLPAQAALVRRPRANVRDVFDGRGKGKKVCMPKKEYLAEHEQLLDVLSHPSQAKLRKELSKQTAEVKKRGKGKDDFDFPVVRKGDKRVELSGPRTAAMMNQRRREKAEAERRVRERLEREEAERIARQRQMDASDGERERERRRAESRRKVTSGFGHSDYLRKARANAKAYGLDPKKLTMGEGKHKLTYDGIGFGLKNYNDFLLLSAEEKAGRVPKGTAEKKRKAYLARATKIKGDWKENKVSPNNLAIHILWEM